MCSITFDFAIEIDNSRFIDCYQSLNLVLRVLSYWENPGKEVDQLLLIIIEKELWWLSTVLEVCEYMSFAKSWQEKGCSSQAETLQVKNILMKDFDWQVKFNFFVISMATWTIEYNLKISLLLSLQKNNSLDFPINLHPAYYNNHYHLKLIWPNFNRGVFRQSII